MLINTGTQERFLAGTPSSSGTISKEGSVKSDSLVATLWVSSTSGTLSVDVFTLTDTGREVLLFSFPDVSSGTTNLLLKKSGVSLQRFRIQATYSGACDYEVYVRAVEGLGESSTKILGSENWRVSQTTVTSSPAVLIPASLSDRSGVLIKNWSTNQDVFIGESLAKADPLVGYPLAPRDAVAMDIAAGAAVYAVGTGSADIRIVESGA
jgi:hypothetical protein